MKKAIYVILTSILLLAITSVQHQETLRQQEAGLLVKEIDTLDALYRETAGDLEKALEKNQQLIKELHEAVIKIDQIEKRNSELEEILFNQKQTYRTAVAMQGSNMPILTRSSFTETMYERAWKTLNRPGMEGTGAAFVQAEKTYGVNSLVLASIAFLESGGATTEIAIHKNNLLGLGAYSIDPFKYAITFDHKNDSILFAARLLRNKYLDRSGRYYRGDNLHSVNIMYAEDPYWAVKVGRCMSMIARAAIPEGR